MSAIATRRGNARLLVFGIGRDSDFWARTMNPHGETVFLEDNAEWASMAGNLTVHTVRYATAPNAQWQQKLQSQHGQGGARILRKEDEKLLEIEGVPPGLFERWWDVILIDAPAGYNGRMPGRMAPIYQAARILARQRAARPCAAVDVFVHDFNRQIEREWSLLFLAPQARFMNFGNLAMPTQSRTTNFPNATFLGWFHVP